MAHLKSVHIWIAHRRSKKNFMLFYLHGDCLLLHFVSHLKCFLRFPSYIRSFLFCSVWKITLASSFSYSICLYSFSLPLCLLFLWQFTRLKCVNIYTKTHTHKTHIHIQKMSAQLRIHTTSWKEIQSKHESKHMFLLYQCIEIT